MLYLVSPDYALRAGEPREFSLEAARGSRQSGTSVFFSSAVEVGRGPLPDRRHLARGGAGRDRPDARAGAGAGRRLRLDACPGWSGAATSAEESYLQGLGALLAT